MELSIRSAQASDAQLLFDMITELAVYEREPDAVKVSAADLAQQLSSAQPPFHCLIAETNNQPIGFALYFYSYSTWEGKPTLYLEDLYVRSQFRSVGAGMALMTRLSAIAQQRNCSRFEWSVLNWNQPAIGFYHHIGAQPMSEWTRYRMNAQAIAQLAEAESTACLTA